MTEDLAKLRAKATEKAPKEIWCRWHYSLYGNTLPYSMPSTENFDADPTYTAPIVRIRPQVKYVRGKDFDTLRDASENALIAWGMGWDQEGVMEILKGVLEELKRSFPCTP